ncbi:zinc-ribbon domain-containing protein [Pontibacter pamirensis]|uniref:zinc-ribbon domain-containing protein n=1 Tax=Pontibacter pamirensis TaxID=2562824 RepID=UPI003743B6E6
MVAPEKKMKTCPNCGEIVPVKTKVCPNCGQILGGRNKFNQSWFKTLTPTEIFLLVLGSIMLGVFLVAL